MPDQSGPSPAVPAQAVPTPSPQGPVQIPAQAQAQGGYPGPAYGQPVPDQSGSGWQQPSQNPPIPPGWAQSPPQLQPKPKRRVPLWLMIAPAIAVVLVAGGLVTLHIADEVNPAVNKVTCDPQNLVSCLVSPPAKAGSDTSSWAKSTTVDSTAYATQYSNPAELQQHEISSLVTADGLKSLVHRSWFLGPNQVDIVLLSFDTVQGAQAWATDRSSEFLSTDTGPRVAVPGDPTAKAYTTATPDGAGNIDARYVTTFGTIDLEVHYASQGTLQTQDFNLWAGTEYASLHTAPAPPPAPAPAPTTFQAATCPGALTSCLMPLPAGYEPIPGVPATYTDSSFAGTGTGSSAVVQRMESDHVTAIDAESWGLNTGASGSQLILMQTRTDSQAQDLLTNLGTTSEYPTSFEIPGYAQAIGTYATTTDSDGFYEGVVSAQVGNVLMNLLVDFTGSFNTSATQTWAVQELNLLTQKTQSHWGFPVPKVSAPTLPAFAPGSCSGAPLTDCVMPVPSGATSTTSSSSAAVSGTISDVVNAFYSSRQNYEQTWLTGDGAKDAASADWTAGDGATATDYVVQFGSDRQAQAAAMQLAGDSTTGSQSCSVASLPDVTCLVLPADNSTGDVPILITGWSGKYEIEMQVTQTDSADTADALGWAQTQMELLAGG